MFWKFVELFSRKGERTFKILMETVQESYESGGGAKNRGSSFVNQNTRKKGIYFFA